MRILILSNSLVVTELFKLALNQENLDSEFKQNIKDASFASYDMIFVDESILNLKSQIEHIEDEIEYKELIAISNGEAEYASRVLKKPFLPEDIKKSIESFKENSTKEPANVLDLEEIERIKSIIELNEYEDKLTQKSAVESLAAKESFKAKNKEAKKVLKELCKMDKKELKELFKNSKVTIKIDFKD